MYAPHYALLRYLAALLPFIAVGILVRVVRSRLRRLAERNIISEQLIARAISLLSLLSLIVAALVSLYIITGVHEALYAAILAALVVTVPAIPLLTNAYSYYVILAERVVAPGEQVLIGDSVKATVYSISLFTTILRTSRGETIIMPNKRLLEEIVRKEPMDRSVIELEITVHGIRGNHVEETREKLEDVAARLRRTLSEFKGRIKGLEVQATLKSVEGDSATYLVTLYMLTTGVRMLTGLVTRLMAALAEYNPDVRIKRLG